MQPIEGYRGIEDEFVVTAVQSICQNQLPRRRRDREENVHVTFLSGSKHEWKLAATPHDFLIDSRCVACHAAKPTQAGFVEAPLGIVLETPQQILARAERIVPLGEDAEAAANGKVVLLSTGMSNTTQEFQAFMELAGADADDVTAIERRFEVVETQH